MTTLMVMMTMLVSSAKGMSYEMAHEEAAFIADKMAYELDLSEMQYESVYEVYFDYFLNVTPSNIYGIYWDHLCTDLSYILTPDQYRRFRNLAYFYRPVVYRNGNHWSFAIYTRYARDYFFFNRPQAYIVYRSGHSRAHNNHVSYYKGIHYNHPAAGGMRTVRAGRHNDNPPMAGHTNNGHVNGNHNTNGHKPSHPNGATHVQKNPGKDAGHNNARIQHNNNSNTNAGRPTNGGGTSGRTSTRTTAKTSTGNAAPANGASKPTAARGGRH